MAAKGDVAQAVLPSGLGWQGGHSGRGNVLGLYVHGLFEDPAVLRALFGHQAPDLDTVFDGLAAAAALHFAPGWLQQWAPQP
jgi:adenosylcobyric acid synthase